MSPRASPSPLRPAPALTPVAINILLALVEHDRHGLGIASDIEMFTGGRMVLGPGTLYGGIKRLLESGLIDDTPSAEEGADPRRRYYRITAAGRRALASETRDLAELIDVARVRRVL
jgi:DNA-binding PadR family transcriptional regulator